jgi:hypothetical protein
LIAVPLNTIPPPGEVTPVAKGVGTCALAAGTAIPAKITRLIQNLEAMLAIALSHGLRTMVIVPSVVPVKSIIVVILCCPEAANQKNRIHLSAGGRPLDGGPPRVKTNNVCDKRYAHCAGLMDRKKGKLAGLQESSRF